MFLKLFPFFLLFLLPSFGFAQYFGEEIAKPSSWSFGIKMGVSQLDSDVSALGLGKQGSLFFEKKLFRTLDLRIESQIGQNQGLNLYSSSNHILNNSLNGVQNPEVNYDSASRYFHNYQHSYGSLGVHLKINLNRIVTVLGADDWDLYVLAGFGAYAYESKINALNSQGQTYNFSFTQSSDRDILQERLNVLLDDTFESAADQDPLNNTYIGSFALKTYFLSGGGIRFQLTEKVGMGAEASYLFFGDDLLDGQQWDEEGNMSPNRDKLMSLGLLLDLAF